MPCSSLKNLNYLTNSSKDMSCPATIYKNLRYPVTLSKDLVNTTRLFSFPVISLQYIKRTINYSKGSQTLIISSDWFLVPFRVIYYYYYYYYHHHHRISHFSALAGKYSPILGCSNQQD